MAPVLFLPHSSASAAKLLREVGRKKKEQAVLVRLWVSSQPGESEFLRPRVPNLHFNQAPWVSVSQTLICLLISWEVMLKFKFVRFRVGPRVCNSNELPGDSDVAGPRTALGVAPP